MRSLAPLRPYRQRRHVVVACLDGARALEAAREELAARRAELVVEAEPGPLSAALGRPSVTVADRYGSVGLHARTATPEAVLRTLEAFELECPECGPLAWGDPSG